MNKELGKAPVEKQGRPDRNTREHALVKGCLPCRRTIQVKMKPFHEHGQVQYQRETTWHIHHQVPQRGKKYLEQR